jgi:hypothetical protein
MLFRLLGFSRLKIPAEFSAIVQVNETIPIGGFFR